MRQALLVSCSTYQDRRFRALRSPGHDVDRLAAVLQAPEIGGYTAEVLKDEPEHVARRAVGRFFQNVRHDDIALLYISGHGIKDEHGRLFFAMHDSELGAPRSTALSAHFVRDEIDSSLCRRIVVILDCCYSGAFPAGLSSKSGDLVADDQMLAPGCAVLTATRSTEYAFEGGRLAAEDPQPSIFTAALIQGLATGEADLDNDGWVGLDELYRYLYDKVRAVGRHQTPTRSI